MFCCEKRNENMPKRHIVTNTVVSVFITIVFGRDIAPSLAQLQSVSCVAYFSSHMFVSFSCLQLPYSCEFCFIFDCYSHTNSIICRCIFCISVNKFYKQFGLGGNFVFEHVDEFQCHKEIKCTKQD